MSDLSGREQQLIEKIRQLSPGQVDQLESLIDQIRQQDSDLNWVEWATKISEPAFHSLWDNPEDAAYDDL